MDAQFEVDQQQIVTVGPPAKRPRFRLKLILLSLLIVAVFTSPFLMVLAGLPFGGPHANLEAGDYLIWDQAVAYNSESVMHTTIVWNITGSSYRSFTMHNYDIYYNGTVVYHNESRDYSYWPHIGYALSDTSNNNATPTIETVQTAFGEKRVYHYHCPEKSLGDGGSIPPSDTYIGVDTKVVYTTVTIDPGLSVTYTLKDTNAQSILNGDRP